MRTHRNSHTEKSGAKETHKLTHDRSDLRQPGVSHKPPMLLLLDLGWYRHSVRGPTYRRAIKDVSKVVNLDWIKNQACSLAQNIYVITYLFITNNYLFEMIRKIIFTNYFSEFIHQVAIKFRFRKALQKRCF